MYFFLWANIHGMRAMLDNALWFWGQVESPEPAECQEKVKFGGVSPWLGSREFVYKKGGYLVVLW